MIFLLQHVPVCMYECMYVSRLTFVELLMESGVQLGLGEGPINKVGPMSQPRGIDGTASRTLSVANFTLGS